LVLASFLATLGWSLPSVAHELLIDQVSLWREHDAARLRGQVSFDPELTRDLSRPPPRAEAERRVVEFLRRELQVSLNGVPCAPELEVRELYTRGGAVPGDIAMLSCKLPADLRELRVRVGPELTALVVTVSGFSAAAGAQHSVLVPGGETSPVYFVGAPDAWKAGGPKQFLDAAKAPEDEASSPQPQAPRPAPSPPSVTPGFAEPSAAQVIVSYCRIGFAHILPKGWDHLLFVAALVLGARRRFRRLVLELSAFTLAHTLTLGLGALGWLLVPGAVVEPLIAVSIAYMAALNLLGRAQARQRLPLVFGFGLVHGQGFAGALSELGLPEGAFVSALFGFNLGVEIGQLTVAAALLLLLRLLPEHQRQRFAVAPGAFVTIAVGCYWTLVRVLG